MDQSLSRPYKYSKLERQSHFRLFSLEAGDGTVKGSLEEHDVGNPPTYECLSYVWGTGTRDVKIIVNDGYVNVTETLHQALLSLRYGQIATRTLWIDQIVINQDDTVERGQQVKLMGDIYKQAERDVLWLGSPTVEMDTAFSWLYKFVSAWRSTWVDGNYDSASSQAFMSSVPEEYWPSSFDRIALLAVFYHNPVWRRTWIVQEMLLSKSIMLLHGNPKLHGCSEFQFTYIELLVRGDQEKLFPIVTGRDATFFYPMTASKFWSDLGKHETSTKRTQLERYLCRFEDREATDPRDLIYGLLGLAPSIWIVPDYTKSALQVFRTAATVMIRESRSLNMICFDQPHEERWTDLPSWVPQFGLAHGLRSTNMLDGLGFCAGKSSFRGDAPFSIAGNKLSAGGRYIDSIALTFGYSSMQEMSPGIARISTKYHIQALLESEVGPPPPEHYAEYDILWRTILHDRSSSIYRLTSTEFPEFRAQFFEALRAVNPKIGGTGIFPDSAFTRQALQFTDRKHLFAVTLKHNLVVSVNEGSQIGDEICVLETAAVPLVLRKSQSDPEDQVYTRVGTAYVHGIMDGEAWSEGNYPEKIYRIV